MLEKLPSRVGGFKAHGVSCFKRGMMHNRRARRTMRLFPGATSVAAPTDWAAPPAGGAAPGGHCRTALIRTRIGSDMRAVISLIRCFGLWRPAAKLPRGTQPMHLLPRRALAIADLSPPPRHYRLARDPPLTVDAGGGVILDAQVDVLIDAKAWRGVAEGQPHARQGWRNPLCPRAPARPNSAPRPHEGVAGPGRACRMGAQGAELSCARRLSGGGKQAVRPLPLAHQSCRSR
jgi:hypothetical protein